MASLLEAAAPKSDQLNACDFLVEAKTYTIKDVVVKKDGEQRVSVFFEGCKLPWKPCKSMLRVMMVVWDSADGKDFVGKKLTLFNDEKVMWAGVAVGGIRISHMSGLPAERTISLRATKKASISYTVKPLVDTSAQNTQENDMQGKEPLEPEKELTPAEFFSQEANKIRAKAKSAGERGQEDVLKLLRQEWYALCADAMAKNESFSVKIESAQAMHAVLRLDKPISIEKGRIDYGGDNIEFLDTLINKKEQ